MKAKDFLEREIIKMQELWSLDNIQKNLICSLMEQYVELNKLYEIGEKSIKRYEIDFDGNVLAGIEISANTPKIFGVLDKKGNGISPEKIKIKEKK